MNQPSSILAFNDPYHDSSFCLCHNTSVVHVEMERFTRRKYETENPVIGFCELFPDAVEECQYVAVEEGDFLAPVIRRILREGESLANDAGALEALLESASAPSVRDTPVSRSPRTLEPAALQKFCRHLTNGPTRVIFYGHHQAHAANAFFSSGFDSALTVTLDGGGFDYPFEGASSEDRMEIYGSVYNCAGTSLQRLSYVQDTAMGFAWVRATEMLGLQWGEEGTVMAMAALGDPAHFRDVCREPSLWVPHFPLLNSATSATLVRFLHATREQIQTDQDRYDMAAALQAETERRVEAYLRGFIGPDVANLCVAGGLFLNCQMLGEIQSWFPKLRRVFIPPAPYDGGVSVGAAQMVLHETLGRPTASSPAPFAMGKSYSASAIRSACHARGFTAESVAEDHVLGLLESGAVCGLFSGAAESGRRALGHRSIIADPRRPDMKDRINNDIKHRQWFRPLAPMVLAEHVDQWFVCPEGFSSPYMSFALPMRPHQRARVPAIVHADGTSRVQTVHRELSPSIHDFLSKWHVRARIPMLVNTSFNDHEPIVETPDDALRTFQRVALDAVYFIDCGILVAKGRAALREQGRTLFKSDNREAGNK